jgi:hypothetical protein
LEIQYIINRSFIKGVTVKRRFVKADTIITGACMPARNIAAKKNKGLVNLLMNSKFLEYIGKNKQK